MLHLFGLSLAGTQALRRVLIWFTFILLVVGLKPAPSPALALVFARTRESFNTDWKFQKGDPPGVEGQLGYEKVRDWINVTGNEFTRNPARRTMPDVNLGDGVSYTRRDFDDSNWRKLSLPHDWGIESDFKQEYPGETAKLPWWGVGWYRKHFFVPAQDKGKQLYLELDGAMAYSAVWLNGMFVGGWPYGYASYHLDLTPCIEYGATNVIAIRLDNPPDSSRWYPGGGIYRNVWFTKTGPIHIAHWGTFVSTPEVTKAQATVEMKVTVQNDSASSARVTIRTSIHELSARREPSVASSVASVKAINGGSQDTNLVKMQVRQPRLWSVDNPNLYVAVTTVVQGNKVVDQYETVFGVRTIRFQPDGGLFLNGERIRINGVCNHHDLGPLGTAINVRALERQIDLLKEMGCNAIRTSHNPPAPELLDLCDRKGMLVMDEAFDAWKRGKKRNDYHILFDDWHEKDLRSLVRRDRNHPSVILWSIGNEIREQVSPEGHKLSEELAGIVREEDPTRSVTAGCDQVPAGYNGFQKTIDVFGYNYKPGEYARFRTSNPSIPLLSTESASCISSRGEYFFPVVDDKSKGLADFQMSSYDLYAPRWATTPDTEFKGQDESAFVGGEFVWTGFDYLGEPTPYGGDSKEMLAFTDPAEQERRAGELKTAGKILVPSRSSYFGILDLAGFKKDRFFIYQSRWRPDFPMAHILPHWNWPERIGQVTPVHVYTSGEEAELFLNGRSLGRKTRAKYEYRLRWDDVKYEPGELRVVAYRGGRKWAEAVTRTTGPAARIILSPDRATIASDGRDLSFVTVSIADKDGRTVPRSKNRLRFEITGPGEIVAVDNGDPTNHDSFTSKERNAFNGLCLVIVRSVVGKPGLIKLHAQSDGLGDHETVITAR